MQTLTSHFPFPYELQDRSYTILLDWWRELEAAKGERADLKRADSPMRVAFSPAYHDLLHRLQEAGYRLGTDGRERLAVLAGLAAHIKQLINDMPFARQMGSPTPGSQKAKVSELRFRRLLATDALGELYPLLRRVIGLVDGEANLVDLARVIFRWRPIAEQNPYDPRRDWAYEYYATAPRS